MTAQKGKYIPVNVYISIKDIFIKNCQSKSVLGFNSSEGITKLTNYDISDSNMRCEVCIKELWDDISRKFDPLKELHSLVKALNKSYKVPKEENMEFAKIHNEIDRLLLHSNRFRYRIIWKRALI